MRYLIKSMKLLANVMQGTVNNLGYRGMAEMSYNWNKLVLRKMLTSALSLRQFFFVCRPWLHFFVKCWSFKTSKKYQKRIQA